MNKGIYIIEREKKGKGAPSFHVDNVSSCRAA